MNDLQASTQLSSAVSGPAGDLGGQSPEPAHRGTTAPDFGCVDWYLYPQPAYPQQVLDAAG